MIRAFIPAVVVLAALCPAFADQNDWVDVQYVLQQAKLTKAGRSMTSDAQNSILSGAQSTANKGPWTVTNTNGITAPSKNPHDYLSWAPYHWPQCNWCNEGHTHYVHPSDGSGNDTSGSGDDGLDDDDPDPSDVPPDDEWDESYTGQATSSADNFPVQVQAMHIRAHSRRMLKLRRRACIVTSASSSPENASTSDGYLASSTASPTSTPQSTSTPGVYPLEIAGAVDDPMLPQVPVQVPTVPSLAPQSPTAALGEFPLAIAGALDDPALPQAPVDLPTNAPDLVSPTTSAAVVATPTGGSQNAAKTTKAKASCTPSPTKSLAPSATWTTCPYVVRDGQVNPDVRTLNGVGAANDVAQSILYNGLAYALTLSSSYAQNVGLFVDTFFLKDSTKMNPNMNYGQVVRGPGPDGQKGTFTGILDMRGNVKTINGIQAVKAAGSSEWTNVRETGITKWMSDFYQWITTSDIGKFAASRPNNHGTFYVSQTAAIKSYLGDADAAKQDLTNFFNGHFKDQIAASGEQPFEAARTRPYHYRCFNLEALITNAKLGDQLGLNLWAAKSKYGATIQTAVDFTMKTDPKGEDVSTVFPHVAAVRAAYGDPTGKYEAFLKKKMPDYKSAPYWFYDQTPALSSSPAARTSGKRSPVWAREDVAAGAPTATVPFTCPSVFDDEDEVEVDDGIFVTCDQLRPLFELPAPPV